MDEPVTWYHESRVQVRRWLPKWFPGNVIRRNLLCTMTQAEAVDTVNFAYAHGAFAALAFNEAGTYVTIGGVTVADAEVPSCA